MMQVVAEVEHPETDEVVGAAEHRGAAGMVEVVERNRTLVRRVPRRREVLEPRADVDRGPGETQRMEHLVAHEVGIRLPRDPLDDVVEDPEAEVRVVPAFVRRRYEVRVAADRLVHVRTPVRFVLVEELVVEGESRRVAGHAPHGGACRVPGAPVDLRRAQVVVGGRVEVDETPFHEDHEPRRRDRLRDGGEGVHRVFRGPDPPLAVRPPEPLLPHDLAPQRNRDGHGRLVPGHERAADLVAHGREVGSRLAARLGRAEGQEAEGRDGKPRDAGPPGAKPQRVGASDDSPHHMPHTVTGAPPSVSSRRYVFLSHDLFSSRSKMTRWPSGAVQRSM